MIQYLFFFNMLTKYPAYSFLVLAFEAKKDFEIYYEISNIIEIYHHEISMSLTRSLEKFPPMRRQIYSSAYNSVVLWSQERALLMSRNRVLLQSGVKFVLESRERVMLLTAHRDMLLTGSPIEHQSRHTVVL